MWHEISTDSELLYFMEELCYFHDSCIKELKYNSGSYVNSDLTMHPMNDKRLLRVIIQRQSKQLSMIEMEFEGLEFLKLFPVGDKYTSEILDSSMFFRDGYIYWCDHNNLSEKDLDNFKGTMICSSRFRWRAIESNLGSMEFYNSPV